MGNTFALIGSTACLVGLSVSADTRQESSYPLTMMMWSKSDVGNRHSLVDCTASSMNQLYLNTMLRYLKDKFRATSPQEDADDWIAQWTTLDDSANCPRQYNGYDYSQYDAPGPKHPPVQLIVRGARLSESRYQAADCLFAMGS